MCGASGQQDCDCGVMGTQNDVIVKKSPSRAFSALIRGSTSCSRTLKTCYKPLFVTC